MANSFPPVPSDFALSSITYMLGFNGPVGGGVPIGPALTFEGVQTSTIGALAALGGSGGIQFTFSTAGEAGSFDQAAAETQLGLMLNGIFALMKTIAGDVSSDTVTITRSWLWTNAAGNSATFVDTLPYTPPTS